jgi:hypothetical protein
MLVSPLMRIRDLVAKKGTQLKAGLGSSNGRYWRQTFTDNTCGFDWQSGILILETDIV